MKKIDASKVDIETVREIIRLSELYMDGMMQFAVAADSRAFSLSAMLAAAGTALLGGGIALLIPKDITPVTLSLGAAGIAASVCMFVGLWHALRSGRPQNFYVSGTTLKEWRNEEDLYGDPTKALIGQAEIYVEQAKENRDGLQRNAVYFEKAMQSLIYTPAIALIAGIIAYLAALA